MRKRSKYRPQGVRLDNMTWVQAGLQKLDALSAGTTLKIRNHDAMNNIRGCFGLVMQKLDFMIVILISPAKTRHLR